MNESIERTEIAQQEFNRVCPDVSGMDKSPYEIERENKRLQLVRHMIQSAMQETKYKADIEWGVYHIARELEDTNALPDGITSHDIMQEYYRVFEGE